MNEHITSKWCWLDCGRTSVNRIWTRRINVNYSSVCSWLSNNRKCPSRAGAKSTSGSSGKIVVPCNIWIAENIRFRIAQAFCELSMDSTESFLLNQQAFLRSIPELTKLTWQLHKIIKVTTMRFLIFPEGTPYTEALILSSQQEFMDSCYWKRIKHKNRRDFGWTVSHSGE